MIRIGHGYDAHRFSEQDAHSLSKQNAHSCSKQTDGVVNTIVIGGCNIPYQFELLAHSDGDVLLHALTDAILGALGLGDIGKHFPDSSEDFKNIDSRILLREGFKKAKAMGYQLGNTDITIVAQAPKMAPFIDHMRKNIAEDLEVSKSQVNVKATTTEKMGFTGRKEGIAVHAVVLLLKNQN